MPDKATPTTGPSRGRHIVDTMSDSQQPEGQPSTPRLQPAVPIPRRIEPTPLPVPRSTFSTYSPFQPKCGHLSMSRVYHVGYRCERCHRHGPFGWLYRCTEHRELILDDMHHHGFKSAFDDIGEQFSHQMSLGKWGPDKRQDKYSVLHEMTQEQLQSYTPQQIATLLAQRQNVWKTAEREMHPPQQVRGRAPVRWSLGANPLVSAGNLFETIPDEISVNRPWVPRVQDECTFTACHHCYRGAADKSWLSLNGILNGDIPPTAATAYAFHSFQDRPECDASVVSNLGYRAVPMPRGHMARQPAGGLAQPKDTTAICKVQYDPEEYDPDNDSEWTTTDDDSSFYSDSEEEVTQEQPGASPLPSKSLRRSIPLHILRQRLDPSAQAVVLDHKETGSETAHVEYSRYTVDTMPYLPEDSYASNAFSAMEDVAQVAAQIPLPGPSYDEELHFTEGAIPGNLVTEEEHEVQHFDSQAPHVPGGIAVREEAEVAGLVDLVTQV